LGNGHKETGCEHVSWRQVTGSFEHINEPLGVLKKLLNFWLVEELEAFPKGLSSMEVLSYVTYFCPWGRDIVVGTASRFGLEIKSRWGWDIMRQSGKVWNPNSFLHYEHRIIPCDKATGGWCWPHTPSIADVKERVELYTSIPSLTS
jgi:hypothetical protein